MLTLSAARNERHIMNTMVRMASLGLLPVLPLLAQNAAPDAAQREFFAGVRQHMIQTIRQQPNYTCLETIDRSSRASGAKEFRADDRVRLEVALVDGKEMFAWPGSKQFEDTDLQNFFSGGMYGTGEFAAFARGIFGGATTTFKIEGQQTLDGAPAQQYSFRVQMEHGMLLQGPHQKALAGYHGSFYVRPGSQDVVRMELESDDLHGLLDLRRVTDSIEYGRMKIGEGDFLLPVSGETIMYSVGGDASRNHVAFSGCHEFTGESKLIFGDAAGAGDSLGALSAKQEIHLPGNLTVNVRLNADIDLDSAAVGDPVTAALYNDVKVKGKVVLPKGAVVSGRIVRLERSVNYTVLGLMFQDADTDQGHAALNLSFDQSEGPDVLGRSDRWSMRSPLRPHEGLVPLRPGNKRGRGAVLSWRT